MGRPTDELRAVLDESGVDWREGVHMHDRTYYETDGIQWRVSELDTGELSVDAYGLSVEQVASVTLGRRECQDVALEGEWFECSECGVVRRLIHPHYCPKCGRKVVE